MEFFDILNKNCDIVGKASREECHNGSFLLHGVVHILVFNDSGSVILQKRSKNKKIQPGKWDTSVGGHIASGESLSNALNREADEELGIRDTQFERLYSYIMESEIEREFVTTFRCTWNGHIKFNEDEIEEARYFKPEEIESFLGTCFFSPNFEEEWNHYKNWLHGY